MSNKHDHHWPGCEHKNLAFCKHCKVPYCKDCNHEWAEKYNFTYYPQYYNQNTLLGNSNPLVTYTGNSNELNDGHTVTCNHTEV